MKFLAYATDKKTNERLRVWAVRMNKKGEITHVDLEPNPTDSCWEPIKNFRFTYSITDEELEVHLGGSTGI